MSAPAPVPQKRPLDILLVEDSPGDVRLIQEMLRGLPDPGCTLTSRSRLSEAQHYLQTAHPEVILMDLGLPDALDLEAMEGLRRLAGGIPIVVLTGMDDPRLSQRALEQGAQDYLVKGHFDAGMLLRSLRYAMDRQRREAALRANLVSTFLRCIVEEGPNTPEDFTAEVRGLGQVPDEVLESAVGNALDRSAAAPARAAQEGREAMGSPPSDARLQQVADQLQLLSRQLVDVQEHERYTLSRELHDRVGQNLTALALDLDLMARHLGEGHLEALAHRLKECRRLVRATSEVVSNVMAELRPQMLDDYGLAPALEWFADQWSQRTGIPVTIRRSKALTRLPAAWEIGLFRIAQEALTNLAKHARASRAWILLARSEKRLRMIIADDGVGFPAHSGEPRIGHGMLIMRERAKSLRGRFYARARRPRGTLVLVDLREVP